MLNLVAPSHGSSLSVGVPPSNQAVKCRALAQFSGAISWLLLKLPLKLLAFIFLIRECSYCSYTLALTAASARLTSFRVFPRLGTSVTFLWSIVLAESPIFS